MGHLEGSVEDTQEKGKSSKSLKPDPKQKKKLNITKPYTQIAKNIQINVADVAEEESSFFYHQIADELDVDKED
jgi:hypothetical protein